MIIEVGKVSEETKGLYFPPFEDARPIALQ